MSEFRLQKFLVFLSIHPNNLIACLEFAHGSCRERLNFVWTPWFIHEYRVREVIFLLFLALGHS